MSEAGGGVLLPWWLATALLLAGSYRLAVVQYRRLEAPPYRDVRQELVRQMQPGD